ncbi:MAG: exodeoxyribonuclease III [Polyangiaceae bacterium]
MAADSTATLRVVSWNVNGIRARYQEFVDFLARERPDVMALQEIKATAEQVPASLTDLAEYESYWHGGTGGYSGVSLHVKKGRFAARPKFSPPRVDFENRMLCAEIGDTIFTSLYLPNGGKDYDAKIRFLGELAGWVDEIVRSGRQLVLVGDMNVTRGDLDVHPSQKKADVIGQRPDERALYESVLAKGLVDVARVLHPDDARLFTWWPYWKAARERNLGWRIDHALTTEGYAARATGFEVVRAYGSSDHAPIVTTFRDP